MHIDQIERMLGSGDIVSVTPGPAVYDPPLRAIRVAVAGDLALITKGNTDPVVVPDLLAGETLVASIVQVVEEGTDAQGLTGFR
jgi:hypothetical protein